MPLTCPVGSTFEKSGEKGPIPAATTPRVPWKERLSSTVGWERVQANREVGYPGGVTVGHKESFLEEGVEEFKDLFQEPKK